VYNYIRCTIDFKNKKTKDLSDPRLGKTTKTSLIKISKSYCRSILILQTAHFLKPEVPSGCGEEEETIL